MPDGNHVSSVQTFHWRSEVLASWDDLCELLRADGSSVAWMDTGGIHIDSAENLADERPAACTHLWGWNEREAIRARIDGEFVFAATLDITGGVQSLDSRDDDGTNSWTKVMCHQEQNARLRKREGSYSMMRLDVSSLVMGDQKESELRFDLWTVHPDDRTPVTFMKLSTPR